MKKFSALPKIFLYGVFFFFIIVTVYEMLPRHPANPKLYAYYAGWSDQPIPRLYLNGVLLASALMMSDGKGNYYTDYSKSNNFQHESPKSPYHTWNNWKKIYWPHGARIYVSYGGETNYDFRKYIIEATPAGLSAMADEIKANIKKYDFDGVDLDIENWWGFSKADNEKFAVRLASFVKNLRASLDLDSDVKSRSKPIILTVGWHSAGPVSGIKDDGSNYTGSMLPFYRDKMAVTAIMHINIMSYDIAIRDFYAQLDLVENMLAVYVQNGIPREKLIFGIQPYQHAGQPVTPLPTVTMLGKYIKNNGYGGLFMWAIGSNNLTDKDAYAYLEAMKAGL